MDFNTNNMNDDAEGRRHEPLVDEYYKDKRHGLVEEMKTESYN